MQLLLLSNSIYPGKSYLEHAITPIVELHRGRRQALFMPFADGIVDWDVYTHKIRQALAPLAVSIMGIHSTADAGPIVKHCRNRGLLRTIHQRVHEGVVYIDGSTSANLACHTFYITNNMQIVDLGGCGALGLINFQINPHYTNQPLTDNQGETRQQRLDELLHARPEMTVVGLPKGNELTVANGVGFTTPISPKPGMLTPGITITLQ